MVTYLWLALGGSIGTIARHVLSIASAGTFGERFPWGTLIINITGSLVIGFFATLTAGRIQVSNDLCLFVMTGICGGFTTFSAFSLQTLNLLRSGDIIYALCYIAASVILCLIFVWLGAIAANFINQL